MKKSKSLSSLLFLIFLCSMKCFGAVIVDITPSNYNGNNISCFGGHDGSIEVILSGGSGGPYEVWYNDVAYYPSGDTISFTNLSAGYIHITAYDIHHSDGEAEITLTEPDQLLLNASIHLYSNGYNVSCYYCTNGIITLEPSGGTSPYTYEWFDNTTSDSHDSLAPGGYTATVTDDNGCYINSDHYYILDPPRNDVWALTGNSGSNPALIGTNDSNDFVFKTNGSERMRLTSYGKVGIGITNPIESF